MEGLIEDEKMKAVIAEDLKPYVRSYLYKTADRFLQTLKVLCVSDPIKPTADRIHFQNGTYFLDGTFLPDREWTMNRLPISYEPDSASPDRWKQFLSELLEDDDILTLQEYLGYCLIATNRGQAMLLIIGKGGEGKSRISAVLQEMFGLNLNMGNISKLESDKFCPANLEGKLLFIDDDIKMEALSSTNTIKTIVTCEGMMELERKSKQAFQGRYKGRKFTMQENYELVQRGFRILVASLSGYIGQELNRVYKNKWWDEVLNTLYDQRDLLYSGSYGELLDSLDIANCIRLIDRKWNDVFRKGWRN